MEADEKRVLTLQRKLALAFQLMTKFQRDRHAKLYRKFTEDERNKNVVGRPREFKGYVPGQQAATGERFDVC